MRPSRRPSSPGGAEYTSPPFSEYIRVILKVSHNLARQHVALAAGGPARRRDLLRAGLKRRGEDPAKPGRRAGGRISFGGGAGGALGRAIWPLHGHNGGDLFARWPLDPSLPLTTRPCRSWDATARWPRRSVPTAPRRGHARAKTGTYFVINDLDGKAVLTSKALAGYLETASGRSLIFAVFVNNVPLNAPRPDRSISDATAAAGRLLGKICEALR